MRGELARHWFLLAPGRRDARSRIIACVPPRSLQAGLESRPRGLGMRQRYGSAALHARPGRELRPPFRVEVAARDQGRRDTWLDHACEAPPLSAPGVAMSEIRRRAI